VNICSTYKIAKPNDFKLDSTVPVIIGELRNEENTVIVDAVYHESVIEQCGNDSLYLDAIIKLSLECVKECHNLDMKFKSIQKHVYKGSYAWDDKGKPKKPANEEVKIEPEIIINPMMNRREESTTMDNKITVLKATRIPQYKMTSEFLYVKLDGVDSQEQIQADFLDDRLVIRALDYELELPVKGKSGEFSKKSRILRISL